MADQTAQPLLEGQYRAPLTDRIFAAFRWRLATLLARTAPPHRPPAPGDQPAGTGPTDGQPLVRLGAGDGERVRVGQPV
jgi:hypothetical protein